MNKKLIRSPKKPQKSTLLQYFLLLFFIFNISVASAADSSSNKLEGVNSKITVLKKTMQLTKKQHQQLQQTLKATEYQIAKTTAQLKTLNQQITTKQIALSASEKELEALEQNLEKQKQLLAQQLRASYQLGEYEYFQLCLNQEDPAKILRLTTYFQYIHKARVKTVLEIQKTEAAIQKKQKLYEKQINTLRTLSQREQNKKIALEKNLQKRQVILKQLNQKIEIQSSRLKEYEADKKQLELLMARLKKAAAQAPVKLPSSVQPTMTTNNHFVWPTQGRLLNRASVPALKNELGIVILAPEGQSVVAVYPGKVVFSGWLKGFGLLMIINHGHGFMTLYAYNQALYQKRGSYVKTGDIIAKVGHTGILPQSGLYFEVRRNGKPVNPLQWLNSKKQ